jgi:hypothetical protein
MDDTDKMMQQIVQMLAKMDADRKADREELLARIKEEDRQANQELLARMDAIHEKRMAMLRYPSEKDESLFWRDGGKSKRK